ncbi:hypothetical protein [Bacillus sp. UNCCL81]|uniref:hypothetical protein n=1 Tax=Bacillus sp. UNCCL81 TaxID=1502755 RepID=UPI0008F24807|nr:hypothetical protein [Bacillus sp. UNCCL81]SFC95401.1 hypothetical protein SAMN02799633_02126 [Bacillus sp. UNCCL81]
MEKKWFTVIYYTTVVDGSGYSEEWSISKGKFKRYVQAESKEMLIMQIKKECELS